MTAGAAQRPAALGSAPATGAAALRVAVALGLLAALAAALFLWRAPLLRAETLALGRADPLQLTGFYRGETTDDGRGYRWTDGDASVGLAVMAPGPHLLRLDLAALRPTQLTISVDGLPPLPAAQPATGRRYHLLVPPAWPRLAEVRVGLQSDTFAAPEAVPRPLGVAAFAAAWRAVESPVWLPALQSVAIGIAAALLSLVLAGLGARAWLRLLVLGMLVALMLAMRHADVRFLMRANALLATLAIALALLVALAALRRWPASAAPLAAPRAWLGLHAPALLVFGVVAALVIGGPLLRPGSGAIGIAGDNFEYIWKLAWFAEALGAGTSPVRSPQIYSPAGAELTISEMTPAHTLLGLPLTLLAGPVASYNTLVLLSFVLTGFFTYLLAARLGAPRGAALVAGLAFAYSLPRLQHVVDGHFGFTGVQWPVLALYAWEGVLTRRRAWDALLTGLALALTFWTSWHHGTLFPPLLALYTAARLGPRGIGALLRRPGDILAAAAVVVALVLPLAQPYLEARARGEPFRHPLWELTFHAATPRDYLLPSPLHAAWGGWAHDLYGREGGEFYVTPGLTVLLLALAGLWAARGRPPTRGLALALGVAFALSLGPELRVAPDVTLRMPVAWLYEAGVPLYGDIRTWGRLGLYVALCAALLASQALAAAPARWRGLAAALAAALVLLEAAPLMPTSSAAARPVDSWLAAQPGDGAVLLIPRGVGGVSHYRTLFHRRPAAQGTGKYQPALYREERDTLYDFPADPAIRLAQRWRVDYVVVVDAGLDRFVPGWRDMVADDPRLEQVYAADGVTVVRVARRDP